jgi:hypothetical protein
MRQDYTKFATENLKNKYINDALQKQIDYKNLVDLQDLYNLNIKI